MHDWSDQQMSLTKTVELFNATFRDEDNYISKSTAFNTIACFHDTSSVKDRLSSGSLKTATDYKEIRGFAIICRGSSRIHNTRLSHETRLSTSGYFS